MDSAGICTSAEQKNNHILTAIFRERNLLLNADKNEKDVLKLGRLYL